MTLDRKRPAKISAVISDVDGTMVTKDKLLTQAAQDAVAELRKAGIAFTIVSSRPPRGMRVLLQPLDITNPIAGFNGGLIATPQLEPLERHSLQPEVARQAIEIIAAHKAEAWVFNGEDWQVRDPANAYVAHEKRTVQFDPTVVTEFAVDAVGKIVGVSADFDLLAKCEKDGQARLAGSATVARSQLYYCDFTDPAANKGTAVRSLARLMNVPLDEVAVIGDGSNDVAMFQQAGFAIAMGNASAMVQSHADRVSASNEEDGFAKAVRQFVLQQT